MKHFYKVLFPVFFLLNCPFAEIFAQSLLYKRISIQAKQKPVGTILKQLETSGGFTFSYNSSTVPADSLVSISGSSLSIKEILNSILNYKFDYKEAPGFIILRYAPFKLNLVPEKVRQNDKHYWVYGYVEDEASGVKLQNASVYDKKLLRAALTDKNGQFKLKLKTADEAVALTISKELYRDTSLMVLADVKVRPVQVGGEEYSYDAFYRTTKAKFARFLRSSRQRFQDANIGGFFANSPFQASLLPGLSSHGMMSSQVINKVSVNAIGGYTAGVNGVEFGGVFNISKKDVKYAQFAGVFNLVGQSVTGVQGAGVFNVVIDTLKGSQLAGVANTLFGNLSGVQAGGVLNIAGKNVNGAQAAGVVNFTAKTLAGTQAAGVMNVARRVKGTQAAGVINMAETIKGAQVSGVINMNAKSEGVQVAGVTNFSFSRLAGSQVSLFNFANKINGTQVGLVNIADSIGGYTVGLLNLARKGGYHSITAYSTELQLLNLSLKTGTPRFYTILQAGQNAENKDKLCSFGIGAGREIKLYKSLYLNPEISHSQLYQGDWKDLNMLEKLSPLVYFKPNKIISIFAGPSFNGYYSNQNSRIAGHAFISDDIKSTSLGGKWKGWIGWSAGFSLL